MIYRFQGESLCIPCGREILGQLPFPIDGKPTEDEYPIGPQANHSDDLACACGRLIVPVLPLKLVRARLHLRCEGVRP